MSCTFYKWKGGFFSGDYWCDKKDCRVDEETYRKYCRNYDYRNCPIFKKNDDTGFCYITTIVCNILSRDDNDRVLNVLRWFRDSILQNNEKYYGILKDYDNIGPIIASFLENDRDCIQMSTYLYSILERISNNIENKNYDRAVTEYEVMTLSLINYYRLKHLYNLNKDSDYDYEMFDSKTSGHGKKKI